jgi:hypothetical protein
VTPITLPITSRTSANALAFADVYGNDAQLVTEIDARDDNYQTLLFGAAPVANANVGTTYMFVVGGSLGVSGSLATSSGTLPQLIQWVAADGLIASKTQKLRLRMQVVVGSTSPSTTVITGGLYPVTISAGNYTLGTVVSGATAASSGLATNTISSFVSSDATIPADGAYCLGVAITTLSVPLGIQANLTLQTRWV